MLSTTYYSHLENRLGFKGIEEADVKHYRIGIDKYGVFDVLALEVNIREYGE